MAGKPKEKLPSLDDDLTVKPLLPPRLRPRAVMTDDQVHANSRVLGETWRLDPGQAGGAPDTARAAANRCARIPGARPAHEMCRA